jgi:hypothetical protein
MGIGDMYQAERDAEDAKRYRFLRDKSSPERCKIYLATDYREQSMLPSALDAAIDADIAASTRTSGAASAD